MSWMRGFFTAFGISLVLAGNNGSSIVPTGATRPAWWTSFGSQARNIVAGRFDTGSGSCRDPYDSPQAGEEKGRPCTSFHACFRCPNGLWFLEDLPQVIATRNRFVSFRDDMKPADWETVYGESVRIINEDIIPAFRS